MRARSTSDPSSSSRGSGGRGELWLAPRVSLRVEVKDTTGYARTILVTAGEVSSARAHRSPDRRSVLPTGDAQIFIHGYFTSVLPPAIFIVKSYGIFLQVPASFARIAGGGAAILRVLMTSSIAESA